MKRIGNTIIIGVDLRQKGPLDLFAACSGNGYGNIKSANTVTPAGITAYDTRPVFTDHLLEYQGRFYRIGEGHKEFTPDKSADADYYLLTLAAVARELNAVQIYDADIHLAAGLPLTWVCSQRESFRQYLMQNPAVSYCYNGKEYSVRFNGCSIYPQGYPAIVPELSHYKGTHLLADIGNGTMNIMYIIDKKPVESKCWTEKLGVNQCMISVKNAVWDNFGVKIGDSVIEQFFRTGQADIGQKYLDCMAAAARRYTEDIFAALRRYEYDPDLVKLTIVGGGGCLIRNFSTIDPERVTVIDDLCRAAKGYEYLAYSSLRRKEQA